MVCQRKDLSHTLQRNIKAENSADFLLENLTVNSAHLLLNPDFLMVILGHLNQERKIIMAKKFISLAISFVMIFSFVFVANADEGIILGYNASFGWKAYGMGGETRHVKMIVVDEDDPRNPEIYSKTYTELTGEKGGNRSD